MPTPVFFSQQSSVVKPRMSYFVVCNYFIRQQLNGHTRVSRRHLAALASANVSVPRVLWASQERFCFLIRDWQLKDCFHIKSNHQKLARETLECFENSNVLKWPTSLHLVQSVSTWGSFLCWVLPGRLLSWPRDNFPRIMQYQEKGNECIVGTFHHTE